MTPKQKITKIVEEYKIRFAGEYEDFCKGMSDQREFQKDKFASTGIDGGGIQQLAREVPVTLHNLFQVKLDKEERRYYNSRLGTQWFAKTFKEFSPAQQI